MNATTSTYDEPTVWAPLLVEWAEREKCDLLELAEDSRQKGHRRNAAALVAEAGRFVWIADWARCRLLSVDDAEQLAAIQAKTAGLVAAGVLLPDDDEPPSTLVALVAFLRARLGQVLPWVSSEVWQTVGMLLMRGRP